MTSLNYGPKQAKEWLKNHGMYVVERIQEDATYPSVKWVSLEELLANVLVVVRPDPFLGNRCEDCGTPFVSSPPSRPCPNCGKVRI